MDSFFPTMCVLFAGSLIAYAGISYLLVRRPDWLDNCQQCKEVAAEKCKAAVDKVKITAQSWLGRN